MELLNLLLWAPLAFGLLALLTPATVRRAPGVVAALGSVVVLALSVVLVVDFETAARGMQFVVDHEWIPSLGVRYSLGVDGISLFLILLTTVAWAAATIFSVWRVEERSGVYYFLLGLGQTATIGAFLAQDLLLFVLFFDLMLIPFYFLIGSFGDGGQAERIRATLKMIVYTLVGSLLMLVGAIATAVLTADASGGDVTFSLAALAESPLAKDTQMWLLPLVAIAFLVKMPVVPIHGWVVDAYKACPLAVLALLSGVLSKVGAYGFLRVILPLFPDASVSYQDVLLVIGVAGILYGSIMAFTRHNLRLIIAYSSIAQLGFILIGIQAFALGGSDGAVLQMVNHGIVAVAVFLIIALVRERAGTEDIRELGGLAKNAPVLAALFLVVTMALLAIPGSANFIGEFYILRAVFASHVALAVIASTGIGLAAFYALRMYQRTMHNRVPAGRETDASYSREISLRDGAVIGALVACIIALALYPNLVLNRTEVSVAEVVAPVAVLTGDEDPAVRTVVEAVPLSADQVEEHHE